MVERTVLGERNGAAGKQKDPRRPQCVGCAPDGPHVSRVLEAVQHQIAFPGEDIRHPPLRHAAYRQQALWGLHHRKAFQQL